MSIQSNINQGLSLAGLLFSQTPVAEAAREKKRIEAQHKTNIKLAKEKRNLAGAAENEALEVYTSAIESGRADVSAEEQTWKETMAAETAAHEQLVALDPTAENVRGLVSRRKAERDQEEIDRKAQEDLEKEQRRLAESNAIRKMILERGGQL